MELLEGLDAETLVRRFGPLPAERVDPPAAPGVPLALEAESRGLVHRDIKPANIFLCRYGEEFDFVKVLDFGIVQGGSRRRRRPDGARPAIRSSRARPRSSPPSRRWATPVDGRADIYATGCVAYWLLTGQLVFTAETPMGAADASRPDPPDPAVQLAPPADPARPRRAGDRLPGQGSGGPAAVGSGARAPARGGGRLAGVDAGAGPGVVGRADADGAGVTP